MNDEKHASYHSSLIIHHSSLLHLRLRAAERLVAYVLELGAGLPLRVLVALKDVVADDEEELRVLNSAGQIPVGLNLVRGLVVVVICVLVALLLAVLGRLADVVDARV